MIPFLENVDDGINLIFGPGHHGLIRGSVIHVFKCASVLVRFMKSTTENTQDAPVILQRENGLEERVYMDSITKKIRRTTKNITGDEHFLTKWKLDGGRWWCTRGGLGAYCTGEPPKKFQFDYSSVIERLKLVTNFTFGSGFYDGISIEKWKNLIFEDDDVSNYIHKIGRMMNEQGKDQSITELLGLDKVNEQIQKVVDVTENVWKIFKYGCFIGVLIYAYYAVGRISSWRNADPNFRTLNHFIQALFSPSHFSENLNRTRYEQ